MSSHGEFLVAVYAGQGLLALALAAYFFLLIRDYQRPYLHHWGLSYLAMALHVVMAALAFTLLVHDAGLPLRTLVSGISLGAVYSQAALLLAGVLALAWQRRLPAKWLWLGVGTVAILGASTSLIGAFDPDATTLRALTRLGVKNLLLALVFFLMALTILRYRRAGDSSGGRFLAVAIIVYALNLLHDLSIQTLGILGIWRAPYLSVVPISDLVLHAIIGVGLVTWLFQQEREAAASAKDEASRLSFYDELTGLPNRANIRRRLAEQVRTLGDTGLKIAFAFTDLDRFRRVNDSLGHRSGDELLKRLAERLNARCPHGATVSRIGNDEFAFLVPEVRDEDEARAHLGYLMDAIREPVQLSGQDVHLEYFCGFALFPDDGETERALMRAADLAHSQARKGRVRQVLRYQSGMEADAGDHLALESDLRKAISEDQLRVFYQPMMDEAGQLSGLEALVRWQHPTRGLLGPGEFLPLATTMGLAAEVDYWVLEAACQQLAVWQAQGHQTKVAVNLSANLFEEPTLPAKVDRILRRNNVDASALQLEITEQVAMNDIEAGNATIERLHSVGVSLALDDFGTGYSSMSWLRRLPVDRVKIDRSFIAELDSPQGRAIVRSVMDLAHALGLKVTAEGVETDAQWQELRTLRCEQYQGFYFSKPLPAQSVIAFWRNLPFNAR